MQRFDIGGLAMSDKNNGAPEKKPAPIIMQMSIFAIILFISGIISSFFPKSFCVPAAVIGTILLYLALTFKIVKLEWVEQFANFLIGLIGFLFVPAGISLAARLDIMKHEGVQDVIVILLATIVLLVVTAYTARFIIRIHEKLVGKKKGELESEIEGKDK